MSGSRSVFDEECLDTPTPLLSTSSTFTWSLNVLSLQKGSRVRFFRFPLQFGVFLFFCFGDVSHRRDARHSHPCEDRRDAETAH